MVGSLSAVTIPNSVVNIGDYAFASCTSLTNVTIPTSVTSIGYAAFRSCTSLVNITFPDSIASIGNRAFQSCAGLLGVYFQGDAPSLGGSLVFSGVNNATAYYLAGTSEWGSTFGGLPTAQWYLANPKVINSGSSFGVQHNTFGFTVSWATNTSVVVEANTNLADPIWSPVQTNTLINGSFYFSDPAWTNYPGRFYRIRSL